jgi:hypothetical protein
VSAEVADVLREALALIEDEKDWCQGRGQIDRPDGTKQSCALNALSRLVTGMLNYTIFDSAVSALRGQMGGEQVYDFNDAHTHAEVVAAFKAAIVAEEWSE